MRARDGILAPHGLGGRLVGDSYPVRDGRATPPTWARVWRLQIGKRGQSPPRAQRARSDRHRHLTVRSFGASMLR